MIELLKYANRALNNSLGHFPQFNLRFQQPNVSPNSGVKSLITSCWLPTRFEQVGELFHAVRVQPIKSGCAFMGANIALNGKNELLKCVVAFESLKRICATYSTVSFNTRNYIEELPPNAFLLINMQLGIALCASVVPQLPQHISDN